MRTSDRNLCIKDRFLYSLIVLIHLNHPDNEDTTPLRKGFFSPKLFLSIRNHLFNVDIRQKPLYQGEMSSVKNCSNPFKIISIMRTPLYQGQVSSVKHCSYQLEITSLMRTPLYQGQAFSVSYCFYPF